MPVLVAAEVAWEEETDLDLDTKEGGGGWKWGTRRDIGMGEGK